MTAFRESKISAHHNYLVDDMLTPQFLLGDQDKNDSFYFLADFVMPGESTPRISCRLWDENGQYLLEMNWNRLSKNAGECTIKPRHGGFGIHKKSGELLFEVNTVSFANGFMTTIKGRMHDEKGRLRIDTKGDSIKISTGSD